MFIADGILLSQTFTRGCAIIFFISREKWEEKGNNSVKKERNKDLQMLLRIDFFVSRKKCEEKDNNSVKKEKNKDLQILLRIEECHK